MKLNLVEYFNQNPFNTRNKIIISNSKIAKSFLILMIILININEYNQAINQSDLKECIDFNKDNGITFIGDQIIISDKIGTNLVDFLHNRNNIDNIEINKLFLSGLTINKDYFSNSSLKCSFNYGIKLYEIDNLDIKENKEDSIELSLNIKQIFDKSIELIKNHADDFFILKFTSHTSEIKKYIKSLKDNEKGKKDKDNDSTYLYNFKNFKKTKSKIFPTVENVKGKVLVVLKNEKEKSLLCDCLEYIDCFKCFKKTSTPVTIDIIRENNKANFKEYHYTYSKNIFNTFKYELIEEKIYQIFNDKWEKKFLKDKGYNFNDFIYDYQYSGKDSINKYFMIPKIYINKIFMIKEVMTILSFTNRANLKEEEINSYIESKNNNNNDNNKVMTNNFINYNNTNYNNGKRNFLNKFKDKTVLNNENEVVDYNDKIDYSDISKIAVKSSLYDAKKKYRKLKFRIKKLKF